MIRVTDLSPIAFPQEFLDVLPQTCDSCGADTEITETLTMLRCPNPLCIEKSVQRLVALLKDIGVKQMGEAKCRKFLESWGLKNPYSIFMYEPEENGVLFPGCGEDFSNSIFEEINKKRKMLLWEYIKIGNLPGIRDSARKLLANYSSLEEFYDDLEGGGIAFVQELLSIRGKPNSSQSTYDTGYDEEEEEESISIKAVEVFNTPIFFKEDVFEALGFVDIKEINTPILNICISTAVGKPYTSKSDFVAKMNEEFGNKVHLNFLGSVTQDCHFLIWSKEGTPTNKVAKVDRINTKRVSKNKENGVAEEEGLIGILTGVEF